MKFCRSDTSATPPNPTFTLCAPVTYDTDPRQVYCASQLSDQFADRYVRLGMPPFSEQPLAHCSVTRAIPRVALPGLSLGPNGDW